MKAVRVAKWVVGTVSVVCFAIVTWYVYAWQVIEEGLAESQAPMVLGLLTASFISMFLWGALEIAHRNMVWKSYESPIAASYACYFFELFNASIWNDSFYHDNPTSAYASIAVAAFEKAWLEHSVGHVQLAKDEMARRVIRKHANVMKVEKGGVPTILEAVSKGFEWVA